MDEKGTRAVQIRGEKKEGRLGRVWKRSEGDKTVVRERKERDSWSSMSVHVGLILLVYTSDAMQGAY